MLARLKALFGARPMVMSQRWLEASEREGSRNQFVGVSWRWPVIQPRLQNAWFNRVQLRRQASGQ